MRHRIAFLIPNKDNFPAEKLEAFHDYWNTTHGEKAIKAINLAGYIQNRPIDRSWHWDQFHGIAELFFDSRESEKANWASTQWSEVVTPDEGYAFNLEGAFSTVVTSVDKLRHGPATRNRVLSLGGDADALPDSSLIGAVHRLTLERDVPVNGGGNELLSVFARGREAAENAARALGGRTVIVDAVQMIQPEGWPNI